MVKLPLALRSMGQVVTVSTGEAALMQPSQDSVLFGLVLFDFTQLHTYCHVFCSYPFRDLVNNVGVW